MAGTIADTTVLSNFAHVRQPTLLRLLFTPLFVPDSVLAELEQGVHAGLVPECNWSWLEVVSPTHTERVKAKELMVDLDRGESDCLAVARARGLVLLTDDRAARHRGVALGIEISGTLGCLDMLIHEGHLDLVQADTLLAEMIAHGYRSPVRSLSERTGEA
jgi:predicted nucleic acid-binding protein